MFSLRIFGVYGHLPTRSENGVAQIQHMCPVVFWTARRDRGMLLFGGHLMVLVFCLVVICGHLGWIWLLFGGHLRSLEGREG